MCSVLPSLVKASHTEIKFKKKSLWRFRQRYCLSDRHTDRRDLHLKRSFFYHLKFRPVLYIQIEFVGSRKLRGRIN